MARASDVRGVELGKPLTFDNSRHGFEKLLTWIRSLLLDHSCSNVIFGVEPTGHYWLNLAQFLRREGIQVMLVNPLHVKKTKELEDNSPTKTTAKMHVSFHFWSRMDGTPNSTFPRISTLICVWE